MKIITEVEAKKVLEVVDVGLCMGVGNPVPGEMCVEAAVCFALGESHGDAPTCVHPVVRTFKISLNDKIWSSNEARARGLRRIAVAQLGSIKINSKLFLCEVNEQLIRQIIPIALRAAAKKNPKVTAQLEQAAITCEKEGTQASVQNARKIAADAAAYAAAAYAAAAYADAAAYAAAAYAAAAAAYAAAAYAADADAAAYAADAAAYAADAAAYAAAANKLKTKDAVLSILAEIGVQALIKCGAEGTKFLYLTGDPT